MFSDSLSCSRIKNISQIQIVNIIVLYELEITPKNIYMNNSYKRNGQTVIHIWQTYSTFKRHLKGQCHEIFCFWFFSWISFPPAPEYPFTTLSNFFENSWRYLQVKVHHQFQRHQRQFCHRCRYTGGKIAAGINDTGGKFATGINATCASFDTSFDSVVWQWWQICHRCQRYRRQICCRCQQHRPSISTTPAANFATRRRVSNSQTRQVGELAFESLKENFKGLKKIASVGNLVNSPTRRVGESFFD